MDLRKVKKLIELLEDSALVELEITEGDNTIRLSRAGTPASVVSSVQQPVEMLEDPPETAPEINAEISSDEPPAGKTVKSPMVGTYYNSPTPDAEPFVEVGSVVRAGQILCIVEAMKTFNQIEVEFDGVIKGICKQNGDPVEYGEPLFIIA